MIYDADFLAQYDFDNLSLASAYSLKVTEIQPL